MTAEPIPDLPPEATDATDGDAEARLVRLETELLLEAIYRHHGFDFRSYASASLSRRIAQHMESEGIQTVSALQDRVLHDREAMDRLLSQLSIRVTSMFRDPTFFAAFREHVVPRLYSYPFVRLWHAGCASGEEVYSMCILLHEEGLADRTRVYATDLSTRALAEAKRGIFPLSRMQEYTRNYLLAGGKRAFSEYYTSGYHGALFDRRLTENVLFAQHDLAVDASFGELNVIICRNVLIYFGRDLKDRVLRLFMDSLAPFGFLCLGQKESLRFSSAEAEFETLNERESIYRRKL